VPARAISVSTIHTRSLTRHQINHAAAILFHCRASRIGMSGRTQDDIVESNPAVSAKVQDVKIQVLPHVRPCIFFP
jgi:hypothetical protein